MVLDDDLGTLLGWPSGLRLAVDNLVRNAVTHGQASRIVLSSHRHDGVVTIVVDDNGRGLPADEHETVLGRFSRGSNAAPGGNPNNPGASAGRPAPAVAEPAWDGSLVLALPPA